MATKKRSTSLGQILKNEGFEALLEKAKNLDEKEYANLVATRENTSSSEKYVSDLDELLFYIPDFYYVKDEKGEPTQLPAPGVHEFIDWAVEHGATPHTAMKHGISSFLRAASLKEPSLLTYLIENIPSIDVHQKDGRGLDAIMYTVKDDSEACLDYLISTGHYDINHRYTFIFDKTLLHVACALGHEHLVDKLLAHGADLTVMDTNGMYPKDMIPTQLQNDLADDEVTPEHVEKWDALAQRLETLTEEALKNRVKKKTYKTNF